MRVNNASELISSVDSDVGKLIVLYLTDVLASTVDEIADRLCIDHEKTRSVCERLNEQNVITEIESNETYALSRAVIR